MGQSCDYIPQVIGPDGKEHDSEFYDLIYIYAYFPIQFSLIA